jgi:hypothetical protein
MPTNGPLTTIDDVVEAMHANWGNLEHGQPYTLEQLVGTECWQATPAGHRKQLGHEFKALVDSGDQPVLWVDRRSDNSQVYQMR